MIKPEILSPDDSEHTVVTTVFDAPVVVKGLTWLPITQAVVYGLMTREAGRLHPERSLPDRLAIAACTMPIILGSEWGHNLAHAAAAQAVGHPVDAIRVTWGMPLLVYHDLEDAKVSPREHIIRALGGPVFNLGMLGIAALLRPFTAPDSAARDLVNAALGMNVFLVLGGLLPIPGIDGGAALKWALVESGQSTSQADRTIQKVDAVAAAGLGLGAVAAFRKRKRLMGGIFAMFAGFALTIATGLLKEKG